MIGRGERWLIEVLQRLSPSSQMLCGDLIEERRRGRSRVWLWRQLACAYWYAASGRPQVLRYEYAEALVVKCAVLVIFAFQGYTTLRLGAFLVGVHLP
jgi:hypothetical protein